MRILHICNDYIGSKVHSNLYKELDELGVFQTVFTYYRGVGNDTNKFESKNTTFIYSAILRPIHRLLYYKKIKDVYGYLRLKVKPEFDICHAVTLFSDGAIAYKLYKEYGIPYIVSVRKTDVSEFLTFAPHTWPMGIKVLMHAKKIVFISKAAYNTFCKHFVIRCILPQIKNKIIIQPNGIDDYWLSNLNTGKIINNQSVLYVGKFDYNKNVVRLIKSIHSLKNEYPNLTLHLVGGGGEREKYILNLIEKNPNTIVYHGKVFDKEQLRSIYRSCSIFAMPSIFETFGLVYIEAMSQNLAVLYTKNQGIYGLFDENIGEAVDPLSKRSIKLALSKIIQHRLDYNFFGSLDFEMFRWGNIAKRYQNVYSEVIG